MKGESWFLFLSDLKMCQKLSEKNFAAEFFLFVTQIVRYAQLNFVPGVSPNFCLFLFLPNLGFGSSIFFFGKVSYFPVLSDWKPETKQQKLLNNE